MTKSVFRRTPVALLNLFSNPTRAAVSVGGVSFALLLVFMQMGFRGAVANTATLVYSRLVGEIVIRSPDYVHLYEPRSFDRYWLRLAESHPDIEVVTPFWVSLTRWQNPPKNPDCADAPPEGSFRTVGMMGVEIERPALDLVELLPLLDEIKDPNAMLMDLTTRAEYGPQNCKTFSDEDIGIRTELGNISTRIAGIFKLGTGLATNGAVLVNDVAFGRRSFIDTRTKSCLGLIQVKPGVNSEKLARDLLDWMSEFDPNAQSSIQIFSMKRQVEWERNRWLTETPIGMIFTMGVVLSFIIGAAIVYMVLATDVTSRISEFATLKAMGYSNAYVALIVMRQAWLLALAGYVISAGLSYGLYALTANLSGIPTFMTIERMVGVGLLAILMCSLSGLLAVRKLWKADPASLF
ncbi:FtsX-like permease family protein [Pirellulaceae bacterium SH449]